MDDDEDLDNFDEDFDDGPTPKASAKRSYTSLTFGDIENKVKDAAAKVADTADRAAGTIGEKLSQAAGKVEEFFDDRKAPIDLKDTECAEETQEEINNPKEDNSLDDCNEVTE